MRIVTSDGTLRIATGVMIAAGLCHAGHDLLRLRAQPSLPDDWISVTTFWAWGAGIWTSLFAKRPSAHPARSLRRYVLPGVAIIFIVALSIAFLPPRDATLAGDGGFFVAAVAMAVEWATDGVPARSIKNSK